jgi:aklavinone 12-hydroxylase
VNAVVDQHVPVLIVGGGLAGLSTSLFLSWRGVRTLLIERHAKVSLHPRAHRVNERTMELMRAVPGVTEDLLALSGPWTPDKFALVIAETVTGPELRRIALSPETIVTKAISPADPSTGDQSQIEPVLLEHARRHGAQDRFGAELVSLRAGDHGVLAVVADRDGGGERTILADYLVAADGHASTIRQRLGIGTHGVGTISSNMNVTFESAALPGLMAGREGILFYLQNATFTGSYISTHNPSRGTLSFDYDPAKGEKAEDFTEERCAEMVRIALGVADFPLTVIERLPWQMASQVADRFRVGRVFLAGDSAHQMTPTGGLGGQTAMQDGFDLAWKLAAVLSNEAGPDLLDTYEAERKPVAEITVARTVANYVERMAPHRTDIPREVAADNLGVEIGYRYRSRGVLAEAADDGRPTEDPNRPTGQPGTRAAHVWLTRDGGRLSTIDLFGATFVLMSGPDADAWADAMAKAAASRAVPLRVERLGSDLQDVSGTWAQCYGVGPAGAVLVRPDGYVAWRAAGAADDATTVAGQVLDTVLAHN